MFSLHTTAQIGWNTMDCFNIRRSLYRSTPLLIALAFVAPAISAQTVKIEGVIKARRGEIMILKTPASPNVPMYLTDSTQVGQVQGLLQARRKDMSMAALNPGAAGKG
jgi:OmpA-OmpF porin, OOP family